MAKYYPDISHYHPVKDWDTVKQNCPFLISKATQGTTYIDTTLGSFIAHCENRGIPYWLYAYLNKGNELAQAKYLVKVCSERINSKSKCFMGYILDVEAGNAAADVKRALAWLNTQGKKTMIYTMYAEYSRYKDVIAGRGNNCAWWEARYGANNGTDTSSRYPCHSGVDLHQYTSRGSVPGIPGAIDLNRLVNKPLSWFVSGTGATSATPTLENAATMLLVYNTMLGEYGSGADRKQALGSRYNEVQAVINHISIASTSTLAREVINDVYGKGDFRKVVLGARYDEVQKRVNQMI